MEPALLQQLETLVRAHRWQRNKTRVNISKDVVIHRGRPFLQKSLKTNTLRSGPIVDLCRAWLGDHVNSVTLNKNVTCCAHRDGRNAGESQILFLGDYDNRDGAGSLELEDGMVFSETGVWHRIDGSRLLHWSVERHPSDMGDKCSVVAWRGWERKAGHARPDATDFAPRSKQRRRRGMTLLTRVPQHVV